MNAHKNWLFLLPRSTIFGLLLAFCCLLSACQQAELTLTPTEMLTPTVTRVTRTSTPTRIPYRTRTPTPTPTYAGTPTNTPLPTATITPATIGTIEAHPLALADYNIWQMKQLNRIGRGTLNDIEYSPDGKYLAVATGLGVYLYDAETFREVKFLDVDENVNMIAFDPEGKQLALAVNHFPSAEGNAIEIWDVETGTKIRRLKGSIEWEILELKFGHGGYIAAVGIRPYMTYSKVWNLNTDQMIMANESFDYGISRAIDISPDGRMLVRLKDYSLELISLETNEVLQVFEMFTTVLFSSDGSKLFFSGEGSGIIDLQTGKITNTFDYTCEYLRINGEAAICSSWERIIQFDPKDGSVITEFIYEELFTDDLSINYEEKISQLVRSATISPDGKKIAIIEDEIVMVISTETSQTVYKLEFPTFDIASIGLIRNNGESYYVAATVNDQGEIQIVDLVGGRILFQFQSSESIYDLAFSPDGNTLASLDSKKVRLWDLQNEGKTYILQAGEGPMKFSPDGMKIAMGRGYSEVIELDLASNTLTSKGFMIWREGWDDNQGWEVGVGEYYQYTSDGHLLTWDLGPGELIIKDLTDQIELLTVGTSFDKWFVAETIAYSSDREFFAVGLEATGDIVVWSKNGNKESQTSQLHERMCIADGCWFMFSNLTFAPQNHLLVSAGGDGTLRFWNIHTGEQLLKLNLCCFAGFTPDGRYLVTAGDGVIRVWGIPPLE